MEQMHIGDRWGIAWRGLASCQDRCSQRDSVIISTTFQGMTSDLWALKLISSPEFFELRKVPYPNKLIVRYKHRMQTD